MGFIEVQHTKGVLLACVVACNSVGVTIAQSEYLKFDTTQVYSSVSHSLASNKLIRWPKLHSVLQDFCVFVTNFNQPKPLCNVKVKTET